MAGFGILGGQAGNNAVAATYYPTDLRSTGVGAALGVGRIGSILGPTVAEFMRPRYSTQELFLVFAVPAVLSAVAVAALARRDEAGDGHQAGEGDDHPVGQRTRRRQSRRASIAAAARA